ncbi:MAG: hypothetical protein WAX69_04695 [Victivallales bacterium]
MVDIPDLFSRRDEWLQGLILSYDIAPLSFFENEVLCRLKIEQNLTLAINERNRRKLLYQDKQSPLYMGAYYNLEGVKVRNGGAFHPKFYLFVNDKKANLAMGSFNLTENSFKRNLETVVSLSFELDDLDQEETGLLKDIRTFLKGAFVDENDIIEGVSPVLREAVDNIIRGPFFSTVEKMKEPRKRQYHFLSSEKDPLIKQVSDVIGRNPEIRRIDAMSPYYDDDVFAIAGLKKLADEVRLFVPAKKSTFPVKKFLLKKISRISVYSGDITENKIARHIHAKRYRFYQKNGDWDLVTSANLSMPGLFNDGSSSSCRNLEIGLLMPADEGMFPGIDGYSLDNKLESIETSEEPPVAGDSSPIEEDKVIIESACFDGKDVVFSCKKSDMVKTMNLNTLLKIGDFDYEQMKPVEEGGLYRIRPDVAVEGNWSLILMLTAGTWKSYPYFVSRKMHTPNQIPSLGASAYQRCLQKGGIDGLELAFRLAEESEREDWLLYLLYSWDLAKILAGLSTAEASGEATDIVPNVIRRNRTDYSEKLFKGNMDLLLTDTERALDKLKRFFNGLAGIQKSCAENFISFGLPIVLEISNKFLIVISKQEAINKEDPTLTHPKYTWFQNVEEYKRYLSRFIDAYIYTLGTAGNSDLDLFILAVSIRGWYFRMHTAKTLRELDLGMKMSKNLISVSEDRIRANWQQFKDDPICREKLNNLFVKYKIDPLEGAG